jgi:hypothetical protein
VEIGVQATAAGGAADAACLAAADSLAHLLYACVPAVDAVNWATATADVPDTQAERNELIAQADIIRDIFGPWPFRAPPTISERGLAWNDGCIVKLAAGIYEDRDFSPQRMGVLADALLDAGCPEDHELLLHLRGPEPHVRGCAAVDWILGRE